jgi:tetratricopeptide (TPR) repeat protein
VVVETARADAECSLGRCEGALERIAGAERDARELGNSELIAGALLTRGRLRRLLGDADTAVADLEAATEAAETCGTRVTLLRIRIELGRALAAAARAADAEELLKGTLEEITALRLGSLGPEARLGCAEAHEASGRVEDAFEAAREAVAAAEEIGDRDVAVLAHALAGRTAAGAETRSEHAAAARRTAEELSLELGRSGAQYLGRPDLESALRDGDPPCIGPVGGRT